MAELLNPGENKRFNYTGNVQSIELLPGKYKLECYGAQGGSMAISPWTGVGGKGGYACGEITLLNTTTLYIYCGQQGQGYNGSTYHYGGWNGGGACYAGASGGGGATDISIKNNTWNSSDHLLSRIIVAGGGGGSNDHTGGGAGGGTNGGTGAYGSGTPGTGGTQTSGGTGWINGSFGIGGGSSNSHGDGGAGGGGWYGGAKANGYNVGGGGGSGYVYTKESNINYPSGCLLDSSYYLENTSLSNEVNSGNGYAIITLIEIFNTHTVTVVNGNLVLNKKYVQTEKVDISYQKYIDASKTFSHWYSDDSNIDFNDYYDKVTYFIMPDNDVIVEAILKDNRLNSNIYKNIFPEEVINMDFINKSLANTIISTEDIRQDNHGLSVNDFVYLDDDGLYKKALAEESTRANVVGIVSKVAGPNVFTLMDSGIVSFDHLDYNDTTILYLSDKIPGKAVHYSEITNIVYIPVAVYIEDKIIIHLQQGSIGDVLAPYEKEEQNFENYTEQELNDVVNQITNGVK